MTEYELIDALNSTIAQAFSISQYSLSIVTGYLLIVHFIGRSLTVFQISFVNTVFLIMQYLTITSLVGISRRTQMINIRLVEQYGSEDFLLLTTANEQGEVVSWPPFLAGGLITLGCLVFMWQVRHSKGKVEN